MDHVRFNAIAPGRIDSARMRPAHDSDLARRDKILDRTSMGCFGDAELQGRRVRRKHRLSNPIETLTSNS